MPLNIFEDSVDALLDSIKQSPKAHGVFEIMVAGEIELNNFEHALREGVRLSEAVVNELQTLSAEYGVPFDCRCDK
jgi:LDH2 family malate/lactate/ureidoglycolate dehydrogenase